MKRLLYLVFAVSLCSPGIARAASLDHLIGQPLFLHAVVVDGRTLLAMKNVFGNWPKELKKARTQIRLWGIAVPSLDNTAGWSSKLALQRMIEADNRDSDLTPGDPPVVDCTIVDVEQGPEDELVLIAICGSKADGAVKDYGMALLNAGLATVDRGAAYVDLDTTSALSAMDRAALFGERTGSDHWQYLDAYETAENHAQVTGTGFWKQILADKPFPNPAYRD